MRIQRSGSFATIIFVNLLVLAAALLVVACTAAGLSGGRGIATPSATATEQQFQDESTPGTILDPELEGSEWILSSIADETPLAGSRVTLEFDGLALRGNAGCNGYGADIGIVAVDAFEIGEIVRTAMACEEPAGVMEQENAYVDALTGSSMYRLQGDTLTFLDEAGAALLVYARKQETTADPASLAGSNWRLESYNGEPVDARRPITLIFGERRYWGQSDCRTYVGSYRATMEDIAFPNSSMLGEPCADEQLFLPESGDYQLLDHRLILTGARGDSYSYEPLSSGDAGDLVGAEWQLLAFVGPGETPADVQEPLPGTGMSASFEAEGTLRGGTGCNGYIGEYDIAGETFSFKLGGLTEAFCEEPEGVMTQEGRYLAWLEEATEFRRAGGLLWLEVAGDRALLFLETS